MLENTLKGLGYCYIHDLKGFIKSYEHCYVIVNLEYSEVAIHIKDDEKGDIIKHFKNSLDEETFRKVLYEKIKFYLKGESL